MFGIGGGELVAIILVALLVFGPNRLPEVARSGARAYREFQRWRGRMNDAVGELRREINLNLDEPLLRPGALLTGLDPISLDPVRRPRPGFTGKPITQDIPVPPSDDYLAPPAYDNPGGAPAAVAAGTDDYLAGGSA